MREKETLIMGSGRKDEYSRDAVTRLENKLKVKENELELCYNQLKEVRVKCDEVMERSSSYEYEISSHELQIRYA